MTQPTPLTPALRRAVVRRFGQIGLLVFIQAVALFLAAGHWDWREAWTYLGVYVAFIGVSAALLLPRNAALVAERGEVQPNAKGWDLWLGIGFGISGPGMLLVAGFDERWTWSAPVTLAWQLAGLASIVLGYALFAWAMATNTFFSAVVRIQKERGHTVVTGGPYRFVRHPGYSGMLLYSLATPVLFGSWWAFLPAILLVIVLVIRTVLEDRTLQTELPGYADYARRTPYRLIPGLW